MSVCVRERECVYTARENEMSVCVRERVYTARKNEMSVCERDCARGRVGRPHTLYVARTSSSVGGAPIQTAYSSGWRGTKSVAAPSRSEMAPKHLVAVPIRLTPPSPLPPPPSY
jgi:hypothetical protein